MPFKDFGIEVATSADFDLYFMSQVIIRCTSGTRPPSPAEGWHIYETDTGKFLVYKSGNWVNQGAQTVGVVKATPEQVTSSTTLQNDDHLLLPVEANTNYSLSGYLHYTSPTTADLKVAFTAPAGADLVWSLGGPPLSAAPGSGTNNYNNVYMNWAAATGPLEIGGVSFAMAVPLYGSLRVAGTAGTLQLQWAQVTASGATTFHPGGFISLTRF